jgi:hypothetical protein
LAARVSHGRGRLEGDRFSSRGPLELYHLAKELGEAKNIADRDPDVIAQIEAFLQMACTDSPMAQGPVVSQFGAVEGDHGSQEQALSHKLGVLAGRYQA